MNDDERERAVSSNVWECMLDCAWVDQKKIGTGCPSWYLNLRRIPADGRAQDASRIGKHRRTLQKHFRI